jgi:hypothetical protein
MPSTRTNYWHPARLFALFSLFSLFALRTGDLMYLSNLLFLLFLLPIPLKRAVGQPSGFFPFVNEGGRRVVRWHRLVLVWVFVTAATTFGCSLASFILMEDWSGGIALGVALGVMYSVVVTFDGFIRSVDELPVFDTRPQEFERVNSHD